ncbi:Uncharacterised protein [Anaerobiospirillum thomasii]|nr:Uncharacterised protein [Anaerobiospirillum thomasii]
MVMPDMGKKIKIRVLRWQRKLFTIFTLEYIF